MHFHQIIITTILKLFLAMNIQQKKKKKSNNYYTNNYLIIVSIIAYQIYALSFHLGFDISVNTLNNLLFYLEFSSIESTIMLDP